MSRNYIALAVAAALPFVAGTSWALDPATTAGLPNTSVLVIGGSTAIDNALQSFIELNGNGGPCASNLALYTIGAPTANGLTKNEYLFSCTSSAAAGLGGANIAYLKNVSGGSATGIVQVARGQSLSGFINRAGVAGCTDKGAVNRGAPFQSFEWYDCTAVADVSLIPNAGVSDEDPTTFVGVGGVQASDASALTSTPGIQQPFGFIVSKALRDRLQAAEGLTSGSEAFNQQPSLTHQQLTALFAQEAVDWNQIYVLNSSTGNLVQVNNTGSQASVHLCRRGDTSGSQLGTNIYLYGAGCIKGNGAQSIAPPDCSTDQAGGEKWPGDTAGSLDACGNTAYSDFVFAGSGTGEVVKCVSSTGDPADTGGNYRIGLVGGDNAPAATDSWRWINVDNQPPTIYSIMQGRYGDVTEDSFNSSPSSLAQNGGTGGVGHANLLTALKDISNKVSLAALDASFKNAMSPGVESNGLADTGILTLGRPSSNPDAWAEPLGAASNIRTTTGASNTGPVSTVTKTFGGVLNNCNTLQQVNP